VREFMAGRVTAFGLAIDGFTGSEFDPRRRSRFSLRFEVHTFTQRAALLRHYLAINVGGTPHSGAEIARVRAMLDALAPSH
jgi:hypothetical protein